MLYVSTLITSIYVFSIYLGDMYMLSDTKYIFFAWFSSLALMSVVHLITYEKT